VKTLYRNVSAHRQNRALFFRCGLLKRRQITFGMVAAAATWRAGTVAAQPRELAPLVYKASGLLMQSQRMSKAFALMGLGIEASDARRVVGECVVTGQRHVEELLASPLVTPARATYVAMNKLWARARDQTAQTPSPKGLDELLVLDSQILGMANEAVSQLLLQNKQPELASVDTAGRLGMLSQRLAKFHFCALWGVVPRIAATQMVKARDDFAANLKVLQSATRTAAQREAIDAANSQWVFFDAALKSSSTGADGGVHARLARASETMVLVFNDVAPKFARVA
jgi:hypothetical protein